MTPPMKPSCPACPSGEITTVSLDYTFFGGHDLRPLLAPPNSLSRCNQCGLVSGNLEPEQVSAVEAIFTSLDWLKRSAQKPNHHVFGNDHENLATRQSFYAELLTPMLTTRNPAILEIGTFDGSLLRELNARFDDAKLHGLDVNRHLQSLFPKGPNFRFFSGSLDELDGPYNLIVLIQSIQYIQGIPSLMTKLKGLLKPGGLVFIQAPDYSKHPYSLLLGDKFYNYTEASLASVFAQAGFAFEPMKPSRFPNDALGVARVGTQKIIRPRSEFKDALEHLKLAHEKLTGLPRTRPLSVLGTNIAAVFVDSVLDVGFFVDESPEKQGMVFHGKKVVHPQSLIDDDTLIIPFGMAAGPICRRFERDYRGRFIPV